MGVQGATGSPFGQRRSTKSNRRGVVDGEMWTQRQRDDLLHRGVWLLQEDEKIDREIRGGGRLSINDGQKKMADMIDADFSSGFGLQEDTDEEIVPVPKNKGKKGVESTLAQMMLADGEADGDTLATEANELGEEEEEEELEDEQEEPEVETIKVQIMKRPAAKAKQGAQDDKNNEKPDKKTMDNKKDCTQNVPENTAGDMLTQEQMTKRLADQNQALNKACEVALKHVQQKKFQTTQIRVGLQSVILAHAEGCDAATKRKRKQLDLHTETLQDHDAKFNTWENTLREVLVLKTDVIHSDYKADDTNVQFGKLVCNDHSK